MKRRLAGGGLDVVKVQHFDAGVSLKRRLGMLLARFHEIGSTDFAPKIVTGTLGRLAGAFLMPLVGSPSVRPSGGHLWGLGVAAVYNGDGTATPVLDVWANKDDDVAALTVDVGPQTVADGDLGAIMRGTSEDAQALVFFKGGGSSGGSGDASYYGDGSDGAIHVTKSTALYPLVLGIKDSTPGPLISPWKSFAAGEWILAFARPVFCTDLTIDAGIRIAAPCGIWCTGTLTINGELMLCGDAADAAGAGVSTETINSTRPGAASVRAQALSTDPPSSVNGNNAPVSGTGEGGWGGQTDLSVPFVDPPPPFNEGAAATGVPADATKNSGGGGAAGGATGGAGGGTGHRGTLPGDSDNGTHGTSDTYRAFADSLDGDAGEDTFVGFQNQLGGAAGASGGASVTPPTTPFVFNVAISGKGGCSGGNLFIHARKIVGSGRISVDGGTGDNGVSFLGGVGGTAKAGGGGGGNPGSIFVVCESCSVATSAAPGVKGLGAGGGADGTDAGATGLVFISQPHHL